MWHGRWFDDDVGDVTLVLGFNDSMCSQEGGYMGALRLNDWAMAHSGTTLGGLIGGYCSAARYDAVTTLLAIFLSYTIPCILSCGFVAVRALEDMATPSILRRSRMPPRLST